MSVERRRVGTRRGRVTDVADGVRSMNDLIQRLVLAIFRQEGMSSTYPNPGNLRGAPWLVGVNGGPLVRHGYWLPTSRAQGVAGAAHLVALRIAEGFTLKQLISDPVHGWAPASDNNKTNVYIQNVKNWANIPDEDQPLWNYLI